MTTDLETKVGTTTVGPDLGLFGAKTGVQADAEKLYDRIMKYNPLSKPTNCKIGMDEAFALRVEADDNVRVQVISPVQFDEQTLYCPGGVVNSKMHGKPCREITQPTMYTVTKTGVATAVQWDNITSGMKPGEPVGYQQKIAKNKNIVPISRDVVKEIATLITKYTPKQAPTQKKKVAHKQK